MAIYVTRSEKRGTILGDFKIELLILGNTVDPVFTPEFFEGIVGVGQAVGQGGCLLPFFLSPILSQFIACSSFFIVLSFFTFPFLLLFFSRFPPFILFSWFLPLFPLLSLSRCFFFSFSPSNHFLFSYLFHLFAKGAAIK